LKGYVVRVLVPAERRSQEQRVAASPETVRRLLAKGCEVALEERAGLAAGFSDDAYRQSGAAVVPVAAPKAGARPMWPSACQPPLPESDGGSAASSGCARAPCCSACSTPTARALIERLSAGGVSTIALELLPRISRAQSMDVLSSQANIAGYKAVLLAAAELDRFFPMLMTAAGTVQPAKVLVLGAGVAGLQAVATARRLGAVVKVSDVRRPPGSRWNPSAPASSIPRTRGSR